MPGKVEEVAARLVAEEPEYAELGEARREARLTIYLNEDYAPLKRYLGVRHPDLLDASSPAYESYAVDGGVATICSNERQARVQASGRRSTRRYSRWPAKRRPRARLASFAQFDELARQAGLEESVLSG